VRDTEWDTTTWRYVRDGGAVVGVFDGAGALRYWNTATGRLDGSRPQ